MLSRIAENLYWMTRYLERSEDTARLINAVTLMALDLPPEGRFGWDALIRIAGLDQAFRDRYEHADETSVMQFLISDESNPSSIISCVTHARENTRTFRDLLPPECWESVNELYLNTKQHLRGSLERRRRYEILQSVIRDCQGMVGLLVGTMSRDDAFHFMRLGRHIERADMTSRILDVAHAVILPSSDVTAAPYNGLIWMNILKALSAYQMYRRYVGVRSESGDVIGFLFNNSAFPRSIRYCMQQIGDVLNGPLPSAPPASETVAQIMKVLDNADMPALAKLGLHEFIDAFQSLLIRLDAQLKHEYFQILISGRAPLGTASAA